LCGDGNLGAAEECDDGNEIDGDGCDSDCTLSGACLLPQVQGASEVFVNDGTLDGSEAGCMAPSFSSIQAAINAAADGDTIAVCPGTYVEALVVTAEVTLRSTDGAAVTTINGGVAPAVDLRRSATTVDGFTLVSTGTTVDANAICPIAAAGCANPGERGSNVTISNNVINDATVGIEWRGKIDCASIVDNRMADNEQHILLRQEVLTATPAILVEVSRNTIDRGGDSGIGV
jgi:cysteine-rich repeat protein